MKDFVKMLLTYTGMLILLVLMALTLVLGAVSFAVELLAKAIRWPAIKGTDLVHRLTNKKMCL